MGFSRPFIAQLYHCKINGLKISHIKPTEYRSPCVVRKREEHCIAIRRLSTPGSWLQYAECFKHAAVGPSRMEHPWASCCRHWGVGGGGRRGGSVCCPWWGIFSWWPAPDGLPRSSVIAGEMPHFWAGEGETSRILFLMR